MSVSDGYVGSEIYDWRDDLSFDVLRLIFKDLWFSGITIFYIALMRKKDLNSKMNEYIDW